MECLKCEAETKVRTSIKYAGTVYRQRICRSCKSQFWTEELEVDNYEFVKQAISYKQAEYRSRKRKYNKKYNEKVGD